jgi:hypothetical protein
VRSLSTPEELAAYLTQLGRDHRKYSVQPEMYGAVGEALMAALRSYAGPTFAPAAEEAWAQAYKAASSLMIDAANKDSLTAPPFWTAEVVSNERRGPGLVCHAEPGTELLLGPALATMTLHRAGGMDLLCVAGGTGLSPVKAIVEQAIRESADCPRQIHLFYGAHQGGSIRPAGTVALADAYPGLQLTPVTSDDPAFDGMQGNVGRVAARYMPHRECEVYVAGPPAMIRETVRVLEKAGLPFDRIHYDEALLADGMSP